MAYKGFRPDLLNRIQNAIIEGRMPRRVFTAREIGELFEAPAWQVLECFARLVACDYVRPLMGPDSGDDRRARRKRAFDALSGKKHKPQKKNPETAQYEIPMENWRPPQGSSKPAAEGQKCPRCGRPIKRRHSRGEFHDPEKCLMNNIRDIHDL